MPVAKGRKSAGTPPSKDEVGDNGREQDSDDESVPDLEDPEIEDVDEDEDDEEEEEEEVEESFPGESEMTALECKVTDHPPLHPLCSHTHTLPFIISSLLSSFSFSRFSAMKLVIAVSVVGGVCEQERSGTHTLTHERHHGTLG
jgi:hypothetical protein